MMRLTYVCKTCGAKARRAGNKSAPAVPAVRCPKGHGEMVREDGFGVTWGYASGREGR